MGKSHDNQNFPTSTKILKDASDFSKNNTAMPYLYKDGKLLNGSIESYILPHLEPSGAILSTANDMARWLKFHLSMGKTESGQQLLNKELLQEAHQVTTPITSYTLIKPLFPVTHMFIGYNYGLYTQEYRGYRIVGHEGSVGGFQTLIWTFPDANVGFFGSVNGPGRGTPPVNHYTVVFYHIVDHLLFMSDHIAAIPEDLLAFRTGISPSFVLGPDVHH